MIKQPNAHHVYGEIKFDLAVPMGFTLVEDNVTQISVEI